MSQLFKNAINTINKRRKADKIADNETGDKSNCHEHLAGSKQPKIACAGMHDFEPSEPLQKGPSGKSRIKLSRVVGKLQLTLNNSKKKLEPNNKQNKHCPKSINNIESLEIVANGDQICSKLAQVGTVVASETSGNSEDDSDFESLEPISANCIEEKSDPMSKGNNNNDTTTNGYEVKEADGLLLAEEQCDLPTFLSTKNCDLELINETRRILRDRYAKNPDSFYRHDYERMLNDDWTVTRFLLRRRLDPKRTAKLMEECGRFRRQYKMSEVQLWEFPIEFHQAGGLFKYARDRVGNATVYMRVKMYRRVPEISDVFKAFILCTLEEADRENNGRGVAVIFDLSGSGLQNVDLSFLSWLLSSFRNYCPKGVSYILVYNLPWFLNATCKLAMTWMSASNRRCLRFVHGQEIESYISSDNLPDYLGGTCKLDYKSVPEGSKPAIEVCDRLDMTPEQALKIREIFHEYLPTQCDDQTSDPFVKSKLFNDDQPMIKSVDEDDDQFEDCQMDHNNTADDTVSTRHIIAM